MALRRALSFSTTLLTHRHHHFKTLSAAATATATATATTISSLFSATATTTNRRHIPRRFFHSTIYLSRQFDDVQKLDPDEVLFEGCDYKHWLIVMDFPHDPQQRPPSHQMVDTYVQTLASVVGSVEEAKKRMYACSTTTYTGFQAEMDEETSKKFEGLPGVLFVLPDSYIDPENKEYGGDKYVNGTIIPRPPPVQYGRVRRNNRDQNSYNSQNLSDGRGYAPRQLSPQQSFTPQQQGFPPQQGAPPQRGFPPQQGVPPQRGFPPQQGVPPQQGFPPQRGFPQQQGVPPQRGFQQQQGAPLQQSYGQGGQGMRENYMDTSGRDPIGGRNSYMPSHHGNYDQRNNNPQRVVENHGGDQTGFAQGQTGYSDESRRHDSPYPGRGPSGQAGYGSVGQGETRQYGTPPSGGYGQGMQPGYEPRGENQTHAQTPGGHGNAMSTEQSNYSSTGYTGMNQGRY